MGGLRRSPPKAPGLWSPLALPLLLTSAVPGAAEPIEPEGSPSPAPVPLLRLEPGWGRLQQTLGLPAWVDLDLEVLAEPMGNPAGGLVREATWIQQTTLALTLRVPTDPSRSPGREWDRWAMHVAIASFNGDPLYAQRLGAVLSLQEVANPVGLWLTRASLQRRSDDDRWSLEAGSVSMSPDLFSTPIEDFYVHDALNGAPVLFSIPNFPIFPVATTGALLRLRPTPASTLRLASFDLAATNAVAGLLGTSSGLPPGRGWTHQLQWSYAAPWLNRHLTAPIAACHQGAGFRARRGSCSQPVLVERQLPGGLLQVAAYAGTGPNRGLYGSATVPIHLPWGLDHRLWGTAAAGFDPATNPTPSYVGGGLVSQGVLPGRPFDLLILGLARTGFSPTISPGLSHEGVVELGYQLRINRSFNLQPSLQWIVNPGGAGRVPGVFAVGLQLGLSF
ncbi:MULTISPECIES: carbohydrate porin [unclassified Cyanobium]|uniref:carbohydrate porin n=1 Tax=unclassified Cyanobium TaxID=2627006 RepID=UPI0020CD2E1F|nr:MULTISPECIES: carbohydrate porin [unclassified Cyanobium]MCP9834722.1 carbohydrate porin [Cyanobium sp. La Preciosa 7G6]MCP9937417.1 carbohydrate porin [Cyanobium sp. Aljojuca 7A6]